MTPFRDRDPAVVGWVGLFAIAVLLAAAFRADRLPLVGGGERYTAEFAEVGGLRTGDEVRVAGVTVGRVDEIALDGNRVLVSFRLREPLRLGERTEAAIRVRTLLGAQYLAVMPVGAGRLDEDSVIPLARTQAPYDVVQAFSDLNDTTRGLDVDELTRALETVSEVAAGSPSEFRSAIAGVSGLSRNLAARDAELDTLLSKLRIVTAAVNSRDRELERLVTDGDTLFRAVVARRVAIQRVLVATTRISDELRLLAEGTRADLRPALDDLDRVTGMLRRNAESLDRALTLFPGFTRVFTNALGSGPWFEGYIQF